MSSTGVRRGNGARPTGCPSDALRRLADHDRTGQISCGVARYIIALGLEDVFQGGGNAGIHRLRGTRPSVIYGTRRSDIAVQDTKRSPQDGESRKRTGTAVRMDERRRFLIGFGFLLASPLRAQGAAAGTVPRVGFLHRGSPGPSQEINAFQRGLRELGYIEGQNIAVEYRFARGQVERLPELAAELVRLNPDVIVAPYTPPALAAKRATGTIPVVFAVVADPVGAGLIANLARPGGNATGLTSSGAELGGKRLELLKQVVPKASRVAVLYNPADRSNVLVLKQLEESAPNLGLTLHPLAIRAPGDFEGAFSAMTRERTHAMFGAPGVLTEKHKEVLEGLAARRRLPTM